MKNSRNTLVMMAGLPGAGKTTLACALGREMGWRVVDKDGYRMRFVGNGMDDDGAARSAYEHSFEMIRSALLRQNTSIIFDTAAIHHFIVDRVKDIVSEAVEAELKVILCVVDRDLRHQRLRSRTLPHTRITGDPITIADYLQFFDHLPEDKLTVYTNVPIIECVANIKKYLLS